MKIHFRTTVDRIMPNLTTNPTISYSGAWLPPGGTPTLFIVIALASVFLEHRSRVLPIVHRSKSRHLFILYMVSLFLGLSAAFNAMSSLAAMRGNGVLHSKPTLSVVTTGGCFDTCRNPIYSSLCFLYLSVSLCWNSRVLLGSSMCIFIYLQVLVIPAEENFLSQHYAEEFAEYVLAVPYRWCWMPLLC